MDNGTDRMAEQTAVFTRMWADFASKMASAGFGFKPDAPPPEAARQMRDMALQAMSSYAEEFMRSPQFLEAMKQSMDSAIAFRKQMNDFLTRANHEMQLTAREDVDTMMQAMRHVETRLLDRMEQLADRIDALAEQIDDMQEQEPAKPAPRPAVKKPVGRGGPVRTRPSKKRPSGRK